MTQQELILKKLNEGNWTCSTELISLYSVDYRSQINKLRKKGYDIIAKPCDGRCGHKHNSKMNMWFLEVKSRSESYDLPPNWWLDEKYKRKAEPKGLF